MRLARFSSGIAIAALLMASPLAGQAQDVIDWEVKQRFRNFDFLSNKDSLLVWEEMRFRVEERETSSEWFKRLQERRLQSPYAISPGPWDEKNGTYRKELVQPPASYRVSAKLNRSVAGSGTCVWVVPSRTMPIAAPCSSAVEFDVPEGGANVRVSTESIAFDPVKIAPQFKIVLGLGDSYGSGQGNPDRPTLWKKGISHTKWPIGNFNLTREFAEQDGAAKWQSARCSRSFWSYQHMAALRMAAEDAHSMIAFVHFACSGAEIVDGLLAPQRRPVGIPADCPELPEDRSNAPRKPDQRCDVPFSQLGAVVDLLCTERTIPLNKSDKQRILAGLDRLPYGQYQLSWVSDLSKCPKPLRIDHVLLSVAGNDMGFGGIIAYGVVPTFSRWGPLTDLVVALARKKGGVVCPYKGAPGECEKALSARERINELPERFAALSRAFDLLLGIDGKKVTLTQYPNPLFDEKGLICWDPKGTNNNRWDASRLAIYGWLNPAVWQMNLTWGEVHDVHLAVLRPLIAAQRRTERHGWILVDTSAVMKGRGWCVGADKTIPPPSRAHQWQAFGDSGRWVRTANDSLLTQWAFSAREPRSDWLGGIFHPTAWAHAAMADKTLERLATQE